jgi:glycosyltransferase involved in cell wall biosynthesis
VDLLKGIKFINIYDTPQYRRNIDFHSKSLRNTVNFKLNFISISKIIKNFIFIHIGKQANKKLKDIDAFILPYNYFPEIINNYNIKKFILLYDTTPILFPDYFQENAVIDWKNDMLKSLDKETYCFCISGCTKNDYIKFFGNIIDRNKMTVTYISSAKEFYPRYDLSSIKYITNKYKISIDHSKYIFTFCSLEPRKNIIFTVKCFIKFLQKNNINDLYFLIGGEQWDNFSKQINDMRSDLSENYQSKIILLGYVDDSDVNLLYSNSLFFTYLSQYEGFGMPVLEAMQAGIPVIASNNSSLPEVTGDAAITIDYDDEEACVNAMERLYYNENLRKEYIKKGFERAKQFSWDKTVNLITKKIKEVTQAS